MSRLLRCLVLAALLSLGQASCASDEWTCDDGECVDASAECDGWADCADLSDEGTCSGIGCEAPNLRRDLAHWCNQWATYAGGIPWFTVWDPFANTCIGPYASEFTCPSGAGCIPWSMVCDGTSHCFAGEDEDYIGCCSGGTHNTARPVVQCPAYDPNDPYTYIPVVMTGPITELWQKGDHVDGLAYLMDTLPHPDNIEFPAGGGYTVTYPGWRDHISDCSADDDMELYHRMVLRCNRNKPPGTTFSKVIRVFDNGDEDYVSNPRRARSSIPCRVTFVTVDPNGVCPAPRSGLTAQVWPDDFSTTD